MTFSEWTFFAAIHAIVIAPFLIASVAVALVGRRLVRRTTGRSSRRVAIICATAVPLLMVAWGLYIAWPWPWQEPAGRFDGFPPGPLLVVGAGFLLPVSGLISWRLVGRRIGR